MFRKFTACMSSWLFEDGFTVHIQSFPHNPLITNQDLVIILMGKLLNYMYFILERIITLPVTMKHSLNLEDMFHLYYMNINECYYQETLIVNNIHQNSIFFTVWETGLDGAHICIEYDLFNSLRSSDAIYLW